MVTLTLNGERTAICVELCDLAITLVALLELRVVILRGKELADHFLVKVNMMEGGGKMIGVLSDPHRTNGIVTACVVLFATPYCMGTVKQSFSVKNK